MKTLHLRNGVEVIDNIFGRMMGTFASAEAKAPVARVNRKGGRGVNIYKIRSGKRKGGLR